MTTAIDTFTEWQCAKRRRENVKHATRIAWVVIIGIPMVIGAGWLGEYSRVSEVQTATYCALQGGN
jgi:O-antigen/teichoic acid export membrane protein